MWTLEKQEKEEEEELFRIFTGITCKRPRPKSYEELWVFWNQNHHEILRQFRSSNNSFSANLETRSRIISDRIKSAFSIVKYDSYRHIFQLWEPVPTISRRCMLSTAHQPFAVNYLYKGLSKYRLHCDLYAFQCDGDAPTLGAFLNRLPEVVLFQSLKQSPWVDSALKCSFRGCLMLPICCPSQSTSSCIGVLECSTHWKYSEAVSIIKRALEEVGLRIFQLQERIPYQIIDGLKTARDDIEDALTIVCLSKKIALAQVWISFQNDNHVSSLSYLEDARMKQMLSLKLTGFLFNTGSEDFQRNYGEYCRLCDIFSLEMGEDFVEKTLEDYKPRFCNDVSKLSGDTLIRLLLGYRVRSRLAICLRSIHTGAFLYVFEFIWDHESDLVIFVEALLLKLQRSLPSFKHASGAELGDELDVIDVENSTTNEIKFLRIFKGDRLSPISDALEEGRTKQVPVVMDYTTPLEVKYQTTPISLPLERIEQQYGNTEIEAAANLKVSRSTLRRKCRKLGILKWKGRNKRKVNDLYSKQSDTNEDIGAIQEPTAVNRNKHTLTIKAEYAGDMIKFRLHIYQSTVETVTEEIGTRFKLTLGTYKVKYLDEDKDWILLTSEEDMSDCIKTSKNSDHTVVRLRVEPST